MTTLTSDVVLPDATGSRPPLASLLNDLAELVRLFRRELTERSWLNAYLLAAGMNQVVEDHLHCDAWFLGRTSELLERIPGRLAGRAARVAHSLDAFSMEVRHTAASARRLAQWQQGLADLVQRLAAAVPRADARDGHDELIERGRALLAAVDDLPPALMGQIVRMPSCFRSFDQQPADVEEMARRFAARFSDRRRPLTVVGIRTSGSYLAPLLAACLTAHGFERVTAVTLRPGRPLLRRERVALLAGLRQDGLALLVDDPPVTGRSLAKVAHGLETLGISPQSIVLLVAVFGPTATLPPALQDYAAVVLPEWRWAIQQRLTPTAVRTGLSQLLGPAIEIGDVEVIPLPERRRTRAHCRVRCRVQFRDRPTGREWPQDVLVKGVGLGYFGEPSLVAGAALAGLVPETYGVRDGVLFRAWLPEEGRVSGVDASGSETIPRAVARYVSARSHALPLGDDVTMRLLGRDPVWEQASRLLARVFGRSSKLARVLLMDAVVQRLLAVDNPSVVDGSSAPSRWFVNPADDRSLLKIDVDDRAFSNLDLSCSDPVYDLAGFAVGCHGHDVHAALQRAYEEETRCPVTPERWFVYELVHLWDMRRDHLIGASDATRARSRALQRYFAAVLFDGLPVGDPGPVCGIDIDGVLETDALGFPGLTPASAMTLRALRLHGYELVLASGRSLDEVRERCQAFGLRGGVAEYGTVIYDHRTGRHRALLSPHELIDLDRLRTILVEMEGVHVDGDYTHVVRAYTLDPAGRRRGLGEKLVAATLDAVPSPHRIRAVRGEAQTDFTVAGVDKGWGLRALLDELERGDVQVRNGHPLAFAIGDTEEDLPMLRLAARAFAPANARLGPGRAGVRVMRRRYGMGLALAATRLLGHPPGGCAVCRSPDLSRDARSLLAILAIQDCRGRLGRIRGAMRIASAR